MMFLLFMFFLYFHFIFLIFRFIFLLCAFPFFGTTVEQHEEAEVAEEDAAKAELDEELMMLMAGEQSSILPSWLIDDDQETKQGG